MLNRVMITAVLPEAMIHNSTCRHHQDGFGSFLSCRGPAIQSMEVYDAGFPRTKISVIIGALENCLRSTMANPTQQTAAVPGRFVIEAIDGATECPTSDASFAVDNVAELYRMIGANASEIDSGAECELRTRDVSRLKARFKIAFEPGARAARLRRWYPLDDLPYRIHTGRELAMMLDGSKPLSYFSGQYPPSPEIEEIPERLFDPYVKKGRFVKREYVMFGETCGPGPRSRGLCRRIVMYALPDQEWRINAMLLLLDTADKSGWSEGFERMQGSLLGYEEWQNDIFIETIYRPANKKRTARTLATA